MTRAEILTAVGIGTTWGFTILLLQSPWYLFAVALVSCAVTCVVARGSER